MSYLKRAAVLLSVVLVSACAGQAPRDEVGVNEALTDMDMVRDRTVDSIRDYRIDGWRYVDRYHVVLTAGQNESYLISFMSPCLGLNSAFSIGFTSTTGGVTEFDDIVVEGPGGIAEVCSIQEIVRLRDSID